MRYLHGCDCYGHNYLGFTPIVTGEPTSTAIASFVSLVGGFLPDLHIGAGRKEANAIVPEQEKLGRALGDLDTILSTYTLTVGDLQQLDYQLRDMWARYLQFIYQDQFLADGDTRASDQSKADMQPQVQIRLDKIAAALSQLLGRPVPPQPIQTGVQQLQLRPALNLTSVPQSGFMPASSVPVTPGYLLPAQSQSFDSGLVLKVAVAGFLAYVISQR